MQDEPTTNEPIDAQANESSEPIVDKSEAADNQATNTSQSSESDNSEPVKDNSDDAEIKEWAVKKGVNLDDPIALAKLARETEKAFHAKSGEASELKKAVGAQVPEGAEGVEAEAYPIMNRLRVAEFYQDNKDAVQYDEAMAKIVEEKPWLAQDLDVLLAVAKQGALATETLKARQEGRKEALDSQANAQRAGAPQASATGKPAPVKAYTSKDIDNMSIADYQALKDSGFNPYTDVRD